MPWNRTSTSSPTQNLCKPVFFGFSLLLLELEAVGFVVDTKTVEAFFFGTSLLLLAVGFVVDTETVEAFFFGTSLLLLAVGFVADTETVEAFFFGTSLLLLAIGFVVDTETGEGGGIFFFLRTPLLVGFR